MINDKTHHTQSGSILIWILIAVALFAGLNYAFTSSSRNSTHQIQNSIDQATSVQTSEYIFAIQQAEKKLKLRGCTDSTLSYETPSGTNANANAPSDESCHIFRINGGAITYNSTITYP